MASPLLIKSHYYLPPALIIACDLDPLFDQAIHFHEKLVASGVSSELLVVKNTPHGGALMNLGLLFAKEREAVLLAIENFLKK